MAVSKNSPSNSASAPTPARNLPAPQAKKPTGPTARKPANIGAVPFWTGLASSCAWAAIVVLAVAKSGPANTFGGVPLVNWAIGISALASPVALIWMVAAYLQRAADVQTIAEPLRRQLMMITGESGAAEARIRRFNQAIREQIDLLKNAQTMSQSDLAALMERVRTHRDDLERFEHASVDQVQEIQDVIRRNMAQVERLMDDKFTMMRVLDDKLVKNGDSVARQTEAVHSQIAAMLADLENNSEQMATALNAAQRDAKKLAELSRTQESSLLTAAESAVETIGGLSGKIDLSVARFLERAGVAREEAERLAGSLDAQTRSLDEFTNTLPTRVSEAESVLRGVADRLYASEQMAREQAVHLSEKLSQQVDGLQSFMDRFTERLQEIDGGFDQRQQNLAALANRIGDTTQDFAGAWEKSFVELDARTDQTMMRFAALNDDTRKGVLDIGAHLDTTTARYEDVVIRMQKLSNVSGNELRDITAGVTNHLGQFEALREASNKAGEEVQSRASAALQNLQYVLERLLAAKDATQTVGETLVKDLYGAVDQNEQLVGRLNEAAQMSVRALGIATESLGRQEGELAERARSAEARLIEAANQLQHQAQAAEKGLREHSQGLMTLLGETQAQINTTEQKLQIFATRAMVPVNEGVRQLGAQADQGMQAISRYGEGLSEQVSRLQQFHARVGGMGEELTRVNGETLSSIEQLSARFNAARAVQEDAARQTLTAFTDMSDRLQREIAGLDGQSAAAVMTLQQAAARVGEQSYQLLQNAENSGAKMQMITSALQAESSQIRNILQKQADDLGADLSRADKQFSLLGETLKQRTDAAYALLDRVAVHYNETTKVAAHEIEARTQRLEIATGAAQQKVDGLSGALARQLELIDDGVVRVETQATQLSGIGGKTLQQLSSLNEKFALTHEAANTNAQQTVARLEEVNTAFTRQSNSLSEAAQGSVTLIQKAGAIFGEQAAKLADSSQQMDQNLRQLSSTAATLADQSAQIRNTMEQQNQRLIASLTEGVSQLDASGRKLEQTTSSAMIGADQTAARFAELTRDASGRLSVTHHELDGMATRAESTLAALGSQITQQAASLSTVSEQMTEQYRILSAANESQRTQLVDLFDRLGSAHGQASEVAERSINHLSDALLQIQRQLVSLSDQSQTTVGNLRMAGTGFADQAGLLIQNAQAAEQQARTVLSVTAALQEQAKHLRESLHGEGERAGDVLGSLLSKLSSGGIELRELASNTELSLTSLGHAVGQQAQGLGGAMQQISDRQRTLTTALDAQRDVLNGLISRLNLAQDETAATAERTVSRLSEGAQLIGRQAESIGLQARDALSSVQAAGTGFADQAGAVGFQAQQAEQQMRGVLSVTAGMQDQARQLREAMQNETAQVVEQLNTAVAKIDTTGNQLKLQSSSAIHTLDQTALQFASVVQISADSLHRQSAALSEAADLTEQRLIRADDKLRSHTKQIVEAGDQTEVQARQLADTAEYATGRLAALRDTMVDADRDGQAVLAQTGQRIASMRDGMQGDVQRLADLAIDAAQRMASATAGLASQSDALRANLAMSESALNEAATLIRDEVVNLPAILDRSTAQIAAASSELQRETETTSGALTGHADRFIAVSGTARASMTEDMRRIEATAEAADRILRQFGATLSEQAASMQGNVASLTGEQQELVTRAADSVASLAAASDRLARLRTDASVTAEKLSRDFDALEQKAGATGQRLAQAGDTVAKNVEALSEVTQRAEAQMLGASGQFREQLERIRTGLQGQIEDINRGLMQITAQLERTGTTLRSTTAGTVADVERIAQRFDQTSKEASAQLGDKTARMRGGDRGCGAVAGWLRRPDRRAARPPRQRRRRHPAARKVGWSARCRRRSTISAPWRRSWKPAGRWPRTCRNRRPAVSAKS